MKRKPAQPDPPDAVRDLAEHLRFLLEREGLTPRQFALDPEVPYSPAMLSRFFAGQSLPPLRLVEVVGRKCGGDREGLQSAYDRACRAAKAGVVPGVATGADGAAGTAGTSPPGGSDRRTRPGPRHARNPRSTYHAYTARPRLLAAGVVLCVVGAMVVAAAVVDGVGQQEPARAAGRPAPPVASGAASSPPTDPGANPPVPAPSQRHISAKQKPVERAERKERPKPPVPQQAAAELVRNGSFTGTVAPWESDGVETDLDGNRLLVGVPENEDDDPLEGVVDSNSFPLRASRSYVLQFDAAASEEATIFANVLRFEEQPALVQRVELGSSLRHFRFAFTSRTATPDAIVGFEFGGAPVNHEVILDNVSLTEAR